MTESSLACTFKLWNSEANERLREYLRCWHNQQHLNIVLTWEMSLCVCVIDLYVASVTEVFFIYRKKKDKLIVGHKCLMVHHTNVCGAITEICGRAKMIRPSHPYVTVPIQRLSSRVISLWYCSNHQPRIFCNALDIVLKGFVHICRPRIR